METKFKLQLGSVDSVELLRSSIINGLTREFIEESLYLTLRDYQKDTEMTSVVDEYSAIVESKFEESLTSFEAWSDRQVSIVARYMNFVVTLDEYLAGIGKIEKGDLIAKYQPMLADYLNQLDRVKISMVELDLNGAEIKSEYVHNILDELAIINEAEMLTDLIDLKFEAVPVETEKNRNSIIEKKLKKSNGIIDKCEEILATDIEKLNNDILALHESLYKLSYESLTDGEKADKARKILRCLNRHRQVLDKLEDKLTDVNELSRQLTIHKGKMLDEQSANVDSANERVKENPYQKDVIDYEVDSANFVLENYIVQIDEVSKKLESITTKIANQYSVMDKLETVFKEAIPSEAEMKKYSSIGFKLQELSVKLDMNKTNVAKDDKDVLKLIDTLKTGLNTAISYAKDCKDLFMRNSLLNAAFKSINSVFEFIDNSSKSGLNEIKRQSQRLNHYSEYSEIFAEALVEYRKYANNIVRDLSIILGRTFSSVNLLEMLDVLDRGIEKLATIYKDLNTKYEEQVETIEIVCKVLV